MANVQYNPASQADNSVQFSPAQDEESLSRHSRSRFGMRTVALVAGVTVCAVTAIALGVWASQGGIDDKNISAVMNATTQMISASFLDADGDSISSDSDSDSVPVH